jgi:hypothetical protein
VGSAAGSIARLAPQRSPTAQFAIAAAVKSIMMLSSAALMLSSATLILLPCLPCLQPTVAAAAAAAARAPAPAPAPATNNTTEDTDYFFADASGNTTACRWSYLPSFDAVRFLVLQPPATATRWRVVLEHNESGAVVAQQEGALLPLSSVAHTWAVPHLDASTYALTFTLTAAATMEAPAVVFTQRDIFTRKLRPWERNALGKEDVVIPPFTPITVSHGDDGQPRVGVVGRDLQVAGTGLWARVHITPAPTPRSPAPLPVPLLSRPMEIVAKFKNGAVYSAVAVADTHVVSLSPTAAKTHSGWKAGALAGTTNVSYDYDGAAKVTLQLQPLAIAMTSLSLRLHLRDEEAPFVHAVTDLIRSHFAGRIPKGAGQVWNSTGIYRFQLPGPLVPYVWVGGAERGLAIFADNDAGWIPAEPAIELLRNGTTLTMQVNLVSNNSATVCEGGGATWESPRTIVLGMMATPAKPQPTTPAASPRSWWPGQPGGGPGPNQLALTMLGAAQYWGSQSCCDMLYPIDHNYSIYDRLAAVRATGDVGPGNSTTKWSNDWIRNEWMPQYDKLQCASGAGVICKGGDAPVASRTAALQNIEASVANTQHIMQKLHARRTLNKGTALLMPYTNPRGVIWDDDLDQFIDEWTTYSIDDPRWTYNGFTCVGCKGVPTGFSWGRYERKDSAELSANASQGLWRGWTYATDPVASYADAAMYYTEKMMKSFSDGIYYDDLILQASYQTTPGPGYVGDDGELHAGVNLWAWRDFMRRSAILQHTIGKTTTAIYMHMTNFNVVPILSWGSIGLDWEWRDLGTQAEEDVQTRNSIGCDDHGLHCNDTSFILAQSTGLQAGIISVAISSGLRGPNCTSRPDLNKSMCQQWLLKTHYATTVPHEMRPEGHFWTTDTVIPASPDGLFEETPNVNNVPALLDSFGYADPACDVYRFFEPNFPISHTGAVVLPLVVRCKGRVLVFFGSFGPRGTVNFELDRGALGLSANTRATDAESGAVVASAGQNFTFGIDKHSFRIVIIADQDFHGSPLKSDENQKRLNHDNAELG